MELKETVDLMLSDDYRERFQGEYLQNKIRATRLAAMVDKYREGTLHFKPTCSLELLSEQLNFMNNYISILEKRASLEGIELHYEV